MNYFKIIKCIQKYTFFILSIYILYLKENETNISRVKKHAILCGPLAIKLLQFILMRNYISAKFDLFLEDCPTHSFEKTKELYLKDFGRHIDFDFTIDSKIPIGSGSIGQVYKVYDHVLDVHFALKSKHPGIDEEMGNFVKAIKIILFIFRISWRSVIIEFVDNINTQLDYTNEANNTILLKEKFKDDDVIVIPTIYTFSKNFIIMEYIEGESFNKSDNQVLYSLYITFIFMMSVLCYDFLHGDLHYGNWKITKENKIVIYDSAIIYSSNDYTFNKNIIYYVLNGNYEKLLCFIDNSQSKKIKKTMDYLNKIFKLKNITAGEKISLFLKKSIENKLFTNKYLINLLNCICIIGDTQKISVNIFTKYILTPGDSNAVRVYTYIDILNKIKKFKNLKIFFEKWMSEDPENKIVHNQWLMDNFGHTDSVIISDIICEKLNV